MDQAALDAALNEGEQVESIAQETPAAIEKIKVGEKEYSQEELAHLVSLGEIGRDVETKYNTRLDRVYPEFTKKSQELAELKKEYEQIKTTSQQNTPILPENEEQAKREAIEAANRLGIVTEGKFEELLAKSYKKFYEQERAAEKLLDGVRSYEKEIDGSDGRPKFEAVSVLEFMRDNGVQDAMTAYKIMHEQELDAWKESQLGKVKKPSVSTTSQSTAGAVKQPSAIRPTKANLADLVNAELEGK